MEKEVKIIDCPGGDRASGNKSKLNDGLCCANTDKEIWRETQDDFYAPSIHVTKDGKIGINVAGSVFVKDIRDWHKLASESAA